MPTTRYRKLPVEITAHRWFRNGDHPDDGCAHNHDHTAESCEGKVVRYFRRPEPEYAGTSLHLACGHTWHDHGWIDTLEGGHTVCPGDWIITGVQGERYPCKPGIFNATYSPAEGDENSDNGYTEYLARKRRAESPEAAAAPLTAAADRPETTLRERIAAAIYEQANRIPWATAHPDDLLAFGSDADAALSVRDAELDRLNNGLHVYRFSLDRGNGRGISAEYWRDVLDSMMEGPVEPCDSGEQHARAQRAEATIAAITALHQPVDCGDTGQRCAGCLNDDPYTADTHPCRTTLLITAAQAREERSPFVWEEVVRRTVERLEEYRAHGSGTVNVHQVLGLLSPTWPDGNHKAPAPAAADLEATR